MTAPTPRAKLLCPGTGTLFRVHSGITREGPTLQVLSYPHPSPALLHLSYKPGALVPSPNELQNLFGAVGPNNCGHANPHVNDLVEFGLRNAAAVLQQPKKRRQRPGILPDNSVAVFGQHAGYVVHE